MTSTESEQQLIEHIKKDKTAFVTLYDNYFDRIYRYVVARVMDQQEAQDITAETFTTVLEKIDTYTWTGKPLSSWIYKIALNKITDHFRQNQTKQKAYIQHFFENEQNAQPADKEMKKSQEQQEELQRLQLIQENLHKLKSAERDIITLKYFENLSYQEIAETLQITTNNVGVKLKRAMSRLQTMCNPS